jgi:hypothetical protein
MARTIFKIFSLWNVVIVGAAIIDPHKGNLSFYLLLHLKRQANKYSADLDKLILVKLDFVGKV